MKTTNLNEAVMTIEAAIAVLSKLTAGDLAAIHKAAATAAKVTNSEAHHRRTDEEQRRIKNEKQRAFRATQEGREYANEASRRSIAAKRHLESVKALVNERLQSRRDRSVQS